MKLFKDRLPAGTFIFALNLLLLVHFLQQAGYAGESLFRPLDDQEIVTNVTHSIDVQFLQTKNADGRQQIGQMSAALLETTCPRGAISPQRILETSHTAVQRLQSAFVSTLVDSSYL